MDIRVAQYSDYEQIALLQARNWKQYYQGVMDDTFLKEEVEDDRKLIWQTRLINPPMNQCVMLIEDDGLLCGFICAFGNHDFEKGSIIESLNIAPEFQERGYKQRLLVEMLNWIDAYFPDNGIYVEIGEKNTDAQQFYLQLGGVHTSEKIWNTPYDVDIKELVFTWSTPRQLLEALN
jgi:GNAT superfamily N-acetyltransferase